MELRQLRYFVAIADRLSFTRAAEDLFIAQPALSAQIQKLEAEVGAPLFTRDTRRVVLTDIGRMVLEEARTTIAHADRTLEVGRAGANGTVGRLSIGYNRLFPFRPISQIVKAFRGDRPSIDMELRELPTHEQFEAILAGELDVGFILIRGDVPSEIDRIEVATAPVVVAVPSNHRFAERGRVSLPECADEYFVLMRDRAGSLSHYEQVVEACRDAGFEPKISQVAMEVRIVLGLIAADLGVTLLSGAMREFRVTGVAMIELEPGATLRYALVWRKETPLSVIRAFVRTAQTIFPQGYDAAVPPTIHTETV